MTIPESVLMGAHVVTIRSDDDTAHLLREEDSRGDSRVDRLVVRVDPDRPHTAVAETLLHELLHALWHQTALRTDNNGNDYEEAVITALAPRLLELVRRNPDLVAYLTVEQDDDDG